MGIGGRSYSGVEQTMIVYTVLWRQKEYGSMPIMSDEWEQSGEYKTFVEIRFELQKLINETKGLRLKIDMLQAQLEFERSAHLKTLELAFTKTQTIEQQNTTIEKQTATITNSIASIEASNALLEKAFSIMRVAGLPLPADPPEPTRH